MSAKIVRFCPFVTLSKEGDSVQIDDPYPEKPPGSFMADPCKTKEEALRLLESIKAAGAEWQFIFRHENVPSCKEHLSKKYVYHFCALDEQIQFVRERIKAANKS